MQTLWQDLRYGARMLLKNPGFTAVAVVTLALGIGANTAIFSVVNAVLLRPLPYPQPERLMVIGRTYTGSDVYPASEPKFLFWRDHNQSFEAMAAVQGIGSGLNLSGEAEPEYVTGIQVSADFFRVLGVSPALGRGFTKEEDSPQGERVVILSDGLWRRRFGQDAGLIGKTVTLNSESYTVVGVLPPGFQFTAPFDVLVPLRLNPASRSEAHNFMVIGRLKPGVTEVQARAEMKLVGEKFRAAYPQAMAPNESVNLMGWQNNLVQEIRPLLLILLGAVSFVLLIACANVAHLQLARASARQKEMAIRLAVGAGGWRLARQLLTEGVLLALAGAAAGLLLAVWAVDALTALMPDGMLPLLGEISFDGRVLAFTLAAAVATGLIFSLAPALHAGRVDVNQSLKEGSTSGRLSPVRGRLRSVLVIAELAVSLVLLIGAALLVRTFANLRGIEPGFDPRHVLTFQVSLSGPSYDTTAKVSDFYRRVLERFRSLPGVEAVAVASTLPLEAQLNLPYSIGGSAEVTGAVQYRMISPDYFRVMKTAVRQGRAFEEGDTAGAESVIIVNEAFARQHFPNTTPLGQRMCVGCGFGDPAMRTIVGVVSDTKQFNLGAPSPPTVYVPVAQVPDALMLLLRQFTATNFVIRTAGEPLQLSGVVKQEMLKIDPALPLRNVRTMEQLLSHSLALEEFNMSLLGLFAGIGLLLVAIGTYGVVSYSVSQRTHEIAIRMALGAQRWDVLKLVLGQGMILAVIGVGIGLVAALMLTRLLSSLLFGVTPTDPMTFASVSLLLVAVALLACYIPARRATRVDPMVALRYE
ncbi:MAG: ABC transporter permease [Acidobacteriota bacterium]|nr:ABC transporter permease [Blastocatellia bacterium]MDW8241465.1 ABC transporter permease [Acidobacteriota bacterium]